jgi:hypothetical protein
MEQIESISIDLVPIDVMNLEVKEAAASVDGIYVIVKNYIVDRYLLPASAVVGAPRTNCFPEFP